MVSNSITNRAIRDQIVRAFQGRGYSLDERTPEFVVAFYASARENLDLSLWDYDYPLTPDWTGHPQPAATITHFVQGTVVIDVVRSDPRVLLWRGASKAERSSDARKNATQLAKAVEAIVARFPHGFADVVASNR